MYLIWIYFPWFLASREWKVESFSRSEIKCFSFGLNFRDFLHAHLVLVLLLRSILCFEVLAAFIRFHYRLLYIFNIFPALLLKEEALQYPIFILSFLTFQKVEEKDRRCILAPTGSLRDGGRSRGGGQPFLWPPPVRPSHPPCPAAPDAAGGTTYPACAE